MLRAHQVLVRLVVLALLVPFVFGACFQASDQRAATVGSGSNGLGPAAACDVDGDCALAAATCCGCPSFAVGAADTSFDTSCMAVVCPMPTETCPSMVATCVAHVCTAACAPVACDASCTDGYVLDATGCLTCACATAPAGGCTADRDCAEVPADCCGCARGGSDTAVLASDAASFEARLGCPSNANCPNTNTCEPAAAARCVQGQCELSTATALPAGACGRADLPGCPTNQQCILNASPDATALGVGVCGTP